jgi:hypothetical protein
MKTKAIAQKAIFSGNVVEIYTDGSKHSAKILIKPAYIKVPMSNIEDIRLGEQFDVTCEYKVFQVKSHFDKPNDKF